MGKTARLKNRFTIAKEETMPNIWNGAMFGDVDWPVNASRGFVRLSWAFCYMCPVWLEIAYSRPFGEFLGYDWVRLGIGHRRKWSKTECWCFQIVEKVL